jgi:Cys-rich four helix bundle protein (predicted Tat secretion target)
MNRRDALKWTGATMGTLLASKAFADNHDHAHHGHSHDDLIESLGECIGTGLVCEQHCIDLLAKGDTALAACLSTVRDMLVACTAMQGFVSQGSHQYAKQFAKQCIDICQACVNECKKHKHQACQDCLKACESCIKECKKLLK